ncbi:DUF2842 domain-containing protein [Parasphingorhabdus sp.]|uniref:DUF2842 domain-containing protein n=1 Tax=Parasphingorhabdus sp. TaxID=2709688 RepID=UPI0032676869
MPVEIEKNPKDQPSWRKPIGMIFILFLILLWCGIAVTLIDHLDGLNFWIQLPIYIILGIVWIFPIRPLLTWMNSGSFRHPPENKENGASDET